MSYEKLFHLNTNPFRLVPGRRSKDIVWAGFADVKSKFENEIKRAITISNSSLILNWGEYGSGKTHAARFFNVKANLEKLAKQERAKIPFSLLFNLPKGRNPVFDIFVSVIDKLDFSDIKAKFAPLQTELFEFIDEINDNMHIRNVVKCFFNDSQIDVLKRYLYGSISKTELSLLPGVLRTLDGDTDYIKILSSLFSCMTFEKRIYSSIIIWIDEFEDISLYNNVNVDKINNFIRELLDNTPDNLLLFLNLTQSTLIEFEDLSQYLSEAVSSRIKNRIEFKLPSKEELKIYLIDILNNSTFRTSKETNKYFPYQEKLIDTIVERLGNTTLRGFNDTLSLLLEVAALENISNINEAFFKKHENEIIGWRN